VTILIDTDVLAIHHIFKSDVRYKITEKFMEKSKELERGTSIFNLLELCGIVASAGLAQESSLIFDFYMRLKDMELLYPKFSFTSVLEFWALHNTELMRRIRRGLRLGDAKIVWVGESNLSEALITWNIKHYRNKTPLRILTPEEWLKESQC